MGYRRRQSFQDLPYSRLHGTFSATASKRAQRANASKSGGLFQTTCSRSAASRDTTVRNFRCTGVCALRAKRCLCERSMGNYPVQRDQCGRLLAPGFCCFAHRTKDVHRELLIQTKHQGNRRREWLRNLRCINASNIKETDEQDLDDAGNNKPDWESYTPCLQDLPNETEDNVSENVATHHSQQTGETYDKEDICSESIFAVQIREEAAPKCNKNNQAEG